MSPNDVEKWLDDADFTLKFVKQMVSPSIQSIVGKIGGIPADMPAFLTPGRCIPILQVFLVKDLTDNYSRDFHLKLEEGIKRQILSVLRNNGLLTTFNNHVTAKKESSAPLFLIELSRPLVRLIRLYQMNNYTTNELFDKTKAHTVSKHFRFYSQLMSVYESACINSYKYSLANLRFELPELALWDKVVTALTTFFDQKDGVLANLRNSTGVDLQFSAKNCQNYYKSALDQYLDGLPLVYGQKLHMQKLSRAIKTLEFYAAGPSLDTHVASLRQECESVWRKGRKLCEAESVTGRLCTLKTHPTGTEADARAHSSGYRTLATCNCGRTIKLREDVFELDVGNDSFFAQECCEHNVKIPLPPTLLSHTPSTSSGQSHQQTATFPWFALLSYGRGGLYSPVDGVPNDGYFVNNEAILQDWDFKRLFSDSSKNQLKPEIGKLSFEYQCPLGHRFYEKRRSRKFLVESNSKNELRSFYQKQIMEKCTHGDCDYFAQLQRIVLIPTSDIGVLPMIEISHTSDKMHTSMWKFTMESYTVLAKDTFYSLRLPRLLMNPPQAYGETYSPSSRCFMVQPSLSKATPVCYNHTCNGNYLYITVYDQQYACDQDRKAIYIEYQGNSFVIICPDNAYTFCLPNPTPTPTETPTQTPTPTPDDSMSQSQTQYCSYDHSLNLVAIILFMFI
eukprot:gene15720-18678_t